MKNLLFVAILIMNSGCFSCVKHIKAPDGSEHLLIFCPEISHCYEQARKVCNADFIVVDRFYVRNNQGDYIELEVKCKKSEADDNTYANKLKAEVSSLDDKINKCFEDFLKTNETMTNYEISFQWTIDENGAVNNLIATESTFSSDEIKDCVANIIQNNIFSKPPEGYQVVKKKFIFWREKQLQTPVSGPQK